MKFTVTLDEFYLNDEGEIEDGLRDYITKQAFAQVLDSIKQKVDDQITKVVRAQVDASLSAMIETTVSELIAKEKILSDGKEVSIKDHIKGRFQTNSGWNTPNEILRKLAVTFGDEMKKRYDLTFASLIVARMNENGLLKDDVAKLLIKDKEKL